MAYRGQRPYARIADPEVMRNMTIRSSRYSNGYRVENASGWAGEDIIHFGIKPGTEVHVHVPFHNDGRSKDRTKDYTAVVEKNFNRYILLKVRGNIGDYMMVVNKIDIAIGDTIITINKKKVRIA